MSILFLIKHETVHASKHSSVTDLFIEQIRYSFIVYSIYRHYNSGNTLTGFIGKLNKFTNTVKIYKFIFKVISKVIIAAISK